MEFMEKILLNINKKTITNNVFCEEMETIYKNQLIEMEYVNNEEETNNIMCIQLFERKNRFAKYKPVFDFGLTFEQRQELIE
jgi:hypothetical protein